MLRLAALLLSVSLLAAAEPPGIRIANRHAQAEVYLPDSAAGFYRGTRFDWSGVIHSLKAQGHDYYGPWFDRTDPKIHDFIYDGAEIVAGPCSAVTGPVDEFAPLGFDAAAPGANFVKIGVGALRRPDAAAYDNYRLYEIAGPGKWTVRKRRSSVEFTHALSDASSGYGYIYRKTVRLAKDQPGMVLEHRLKNTGTRPIRTTVYNHNFLVLDRQPPGPDLSIAFPFQVRTPKPLNPELAEVRGDRIVYLKALAGRDTASAAIEGFGTTPRDNQFRIESTRLGAGVKVVSDRALLRAYLWSIRTVVSFEPFIAIAVEPGQEFTWTSTYTYYKLP
ncbi:MAG TPA: hypothetical protein VF767_04255 [Bryobacteraceae bacterium]